jgi:hypothetical protein
MDPLGIYMGSIKPDSIRLSSPFLEGLEVVERFSTQSATARLFHWVR